MSIPKTEPISIVKFARSIKTAPMNIYNLINSGVLNFTKVNNRIQVNPSTETQRYYYYRMIVGNDSNRKIDADVISQINQMEKENKPMSIPPVDDNEVYESPQVVKRGKVQKSADQLLADNKDPDDFNPQSSTTQRLSKMQEAKLKKEIAMADKAEMELKEKQGLLVDKSSLDILLQDIGVKVQKAIMSIPDRLSPVLAAETDGHKIHRKLTSELKYALRNMSMMLKDETIPEEEKEEV